MVIISEDFQGWPMKAHTLRELLTALGFKEDEKHIYLDKDNELLDAYPRCLEDDGMGYGVNETYFIEADTCVYDEKIIDEEVKVFNVFRETPNEKIVFELREKNKEFEELIKKKNKEREDMEKKKKEAEE